MRINLAALAAALILSTPAAHAQPHDPQPATDDLEQVPITDPVLLEDLGFAPDASNVYATPQALSRMAMGSSESAVLEPEPNNSFGVGSEGSTNVLYSDFRPTFATDGLFPEYSYAPDSGLTCDAGTHTYEAKIAPIPVGAAFAYVGVYLFDESTEDATAWLYRTCQVVSHSPPVVTLMDQASTAGTPGATGFTLAAGDTVNHYCQFFLRVRLDSGGFLVFECSEGNDLRLFGAHARWQRQVRPHPTMPTFDDVPSNHPLYDYIEAVARDGITHGCPDPDNFCPNGVLTRGEIVEILAKALGLGWGLGIL